MKKSSVAKQKSLGQHRELDLTEEFPMLWRVHTDWYWSKIINGDRLCYWPSKKKWRYRGVTETGDVFEFIEKNAQPNGSQIGNAN